MISLKYWDFPEMEMFTNCTQNPSNSNLIKIWPIYFNDKEYKHLKNSQVIINCNCKLLINHSNQISHDPRKMTIIWQIQNKPRVNNCKQQHDTWFNVDDKRTKHKINPFFAQKGKVDCCFLEQILFSFTLLIVLSCSADILCDLGEESGQYANDWHFAWAGYPEISFVIPLYCDINLQAIQWT